MDTQIIELRLTAKALPTDNRQVQLSVKSEVLRISELLQKEIDDLHRLLDLRDEQYFKFCETGIIEDA